MDWMREKYFKKSLRYPWPWKSTVKVTFHYLNYIFMFFTYLAHQTTYENLLKTWLISEIKFVLELTIFKVKGVCGNLLTIFFIFSTWNYIQIPFQTFMTNETNFLHCTLRCLRGWSIYRPAVRSGLYLRYPVILYINFAIYKRSICTEFSPQLKG